MARAAILILTSPPLIYPYSHVLSLDDPIRKKKKKKDAKGNSFDDLAPLKPLRPLGGGLGILPSIKAGQNIPTEEELERLAMELAEKKREGVWHVCVYAMCVCRCFAFC